MSGWHAHLSLHYTRDGERTIALDRHQGPLRVLRRLYPEGPGICHHVIVHPPGGVVGGDRLEVQARLDEGTHALITTPGATRFYRSAGAAAVQQIRLQLAADARLEWLPLEAIAHRDCIAENHVTLDLAPGAECMGWDLLAQAQRAVEQQGVVSAQQATFQPQTGQLQLLQNQLLQNQHHKTHLLTILVYTVNMYSAV